MTLQGKATLTEKFYTNRSYTHSYDHMIGVLLDIVSVTPPIIELRYPGAASTFTAHQTEINLITPTTPYKNLGL